MSRGHSNRKKAQKPWVFGSADVSESVGDEQRAARLMIVEVTRLRALVRRRVDQGFDAQPGSRTREDDEVNPYHSISSMVAHCLTVAEDHLEMVAHYYAKTGRGLRPYAMYTLIRTALETLAYGVWLLQPDDRHERILRVLRYAWAQMVSANELSKLSGELDPVRAASRFLRLEEIRDGVAEIHGRSLKKISSTTEILAMADLEVPLRSIPGLRAWKMCSGVAHGEHVATLGLLEREQITESDGTGAVYRMTTRAGVIVSLFGTALDYLEHVALLDARHRRAA